MQRFGNFFLHTTIWKKFHTTLIFSLLGGKQYDFPKLHFFQILEHTMRRQIQNGSHTLLPPDILAAITFIYLENSVALLVNFSLQLYVRVKCLESEVKNNYFLHCDEKVILQSFFQERSEWKKYTNQLFKSKFQYGT